MYYYHIIHILFIFYFTLFSFFLFFFFFFNDTATTEIYTLSLHDALPIWPKGRTNDLFTRQKFGDVEVHLDVRSEEHTSELQSPCNLVCRLLLEKKKKKMKNTSNKDSKY